MNRILMIVVTMLLSAGIVNAEPIHYTFTGTATGSVNGTAFSNVDVTIRASADTAAVQFDGYNMYQVIPSSTVIEITGIGSGMLTSDIAVFNQQAFNYSFAGLQQDYMDIVTVEGLDLELYDLTTPLGPLSPAFLSLYGALNIPSTMGTVVINSAAEFTFQAEVQTVDNTDSDNDGVLDAVDDCRNTPAGEVVNEAGCSIDILPDSITADIEFRPHTLNKRSRGKWVAVYIELPQGYDINEIDHSSIVLEGTIPASPRFSHTGDHDRDGIPDLMVKFKRRDVLNILPEGDDVPVTVTGTAGSISFEAVDVIRVTHERKGREHSHGKRCKSDHHVKRHKH